MGLYNFKGRIDQKTSFGNKTKYKQFIKQGETMGFWESIFIICAFICGCSLVLFLTMGMMWIFEKTGIADWARGWMWYFGWIEDYPRKKQN